MVHLLGRGQGETRGNDALDGRVIGQVEEKSGAGNRAGLLEVVPEEARRLHVHASVVKVKEGANKMSGRQGSEKGGRQEWLEDVFPDVFRRLHCSW